MDYDMDDPRFTEVDPELLREFMERHNFPEKPERSSLIWDGFPEDNANNKEE